ncbi:LOW QUALITY PROTEIN: uncharacterized protein Dmoj_GI16327 [Drosophila mojavensis]|uniref:Protein sex-lethal n=1 Tax=Drosophila mojavensis TaxID=7230 RepID=B4L697_DROMO|nr:LOW QUALITY PROTEIN: uncharacterized protein Dmoj_GI16327 [Drosophila mojavensis]
MPKPDKIKQRAKFKEEDDEDEGSSDIDEKDSEDTVVQERDSQDSQDDGEDMEADSDDDDTSDSDDNNDNGGNGGNGGNDGKGGKEDEDAAEKSKSTARDIKNNQNSKMQQQSQQQQQNKQSNTSGAAAAGAASAAAAANTAEDRTSATNLIINYLPQDMTDRELYRLFSSCGSINTCKIMRDYKTGYSFGYGFVDYNSEVDSEEAIQKLNGFYVRNKRLKVSYARPGGQSIKDTNLYVINLSRNINDDQLDRIFSPYGLIVQRNILRDKLTGRPRGVAFVRYNKREEAQEAIKALNNTVPEGGSQPIWVRLAEEHGKAKAAQFMSQIGGGPHMGQPQPPLPHHMGGHMQQQQVPHHPQQMHHQQQQPHHQQHHPQHHHQHQQQHHHHQQHHSLPPPPHHHMQQLHHHPHGGGGGMGVGVGVGVGVGLPQPMHGGGGVVGGGGGGVGGYHHNMAHRGRSNRTTRSQKPHPYNHAQKFI